LESIFFETGQMKATEHQQSLIVGSNMSCHMCHHKREKVYSNCKRNSPGHFYCESHITSRLGISMSDLLIDSSIFPECPVCTRNCPCGPCQRKKKQQEGGSPAVGDPVGGGRKRANSQDGVENSGDDDFPEEKKINGPGVEYFQRINRPKPTAPEFVPDPNRPRAWEYIANGNCHICHCVKEVYTNCRKRYMGHCLCANHLYSKLGYTVEQLQQDPVLYPECAICTLNCPCRACQRKKDQGSGPRETTSQQASPPHPHMYSYGIPSSVQIMPMALPEETTEAFWI